MKQLSLIDSMFLYAEDARMPMHIGSLYIMASDEEKEFNLDEFKQFFEERLHLTPVFRRRLIETPLNIGRPYWINDPDFNLDNHISHIALPKGGTRADLLKLVSQIYSQPLDRTKPLWSNTVITGLDNIPSIPKNGFAIVSKVHHANIDGMSGAEIQKATFDLSSTPRKIEPPTEPFKAEALEKIPALIARDYAKQMMKTPEKMIGFFKSSSEAVGSLVKSGLSPKDMGKAVFKPMAPQSLFNKSVTPNKSFGIIDFPIAKVKKVKDLAGVKVNDVMLAICGGGMRKYLLEKKELPQRSLVAGVPVSLRTKEQQSDMGNQVTMMQVALGTTEADSLQRLKKISEDTKSSKVIARAAPVSKIAELIPSSVAAAAAKVYTRNGALTKYALFQNVVITNVPGPRMPLYIAGFRIVYHYGLGITVENMGLMITIFSMENNVSITLTACQKLVPDVQKLADYIKEELSNLERILTSKEEEKDIFQELAAKFNMPETQRNLL